MHPARINALENQGEKVELKKQIEALERNHQKHTRQIEELQASSTILSEITSTPKPKSRPFRHQFLDIARYVLGPRGRDNALYREVWEIVEVAHKPDAVLDAALYTENERTDIDTYYAVYGLSPRVVRELANQEYDHAVHLINTHAGRRIKGETIPDSVEKKFLDLLAGMHGDSYWRLRSATKSRRWFLAD